MFILDFTSLTIFVSRTFWLNWLIVCRILWIQSPRNYDFPDPSIGWSCGPFAEQQSIGSSALSLLWMAHLWISLLINRISVSAPDPEREAGDMIYVGPGLGCSDPIFPRFLPLCTVSGLQSAGLTADCLLLLVVLGGVSRSLRTITTLSNISSPSS